MNCDKTLKGRLSGIGLARAGCTTAAASAGGSPATATDASAGSRRATATGGAAAVIETATGGAAATAPGGRDFQSSAARTDHHQQRWA